MRLVNCKLDMCHRFSLEPLSGLCASGFPLVICIEDTMTGCLICYRRLDTVWKFGCRASSWTDVLECVEYSHHKLRKACSWRYSMRSTWIGWCKFSQMAVQSNQGAQRLPRISPVILESNPNQLFHQKFLGTFVSWCVFVSNIIALESSESKITLFKPMAHIFLWILVFCRSHKIVVHIDSTQTL